MYDGPSEPLPSYRFYEGDKKVFLIKWRKLTFEMESILEENYCDNLQLPSSQSYVASQF